MACALALAPSFAFAQEAQPATEEEAATTASDTETLDAVVVTGIRQSIATSRDTKQESSSIVEAVSAEDLGKLPDVSIAESLARLPGMAAQRVDGRAQVIAIRGLSPDFAATLLNGREQVTTGDNRGVEFDQYPSELLHGAVVYKTPDASVIGQGLSGTVDLRTIRPLDFDERRIVVNARGEHNSLGEQNFDGSDNGYRVSGSYVDQFLDDTVGVAIGVARLDSPFQEQHYKAWWWGNNEGWENYIPVPGKPVGAVMQMGAEAWLRSRDQVRDGIMGVFEFKPNDGFHSILDLYYSTFDQQENTRGLMWDQSAESGTSGCTRCVFLTDATTSDVGGVPVVDGGTVHNVTPIVRNDHNDRDDTMFSMGWKNTLELDEAWTATSDLYYSRAKRDSTWMETYAGAPGPDSIGFSLPLGSSGFPTFSPGYDYADPDVILLGDPAGWGREGRVETTRQDDQLSGLRLELARTFDAGAFTGLQVGFAGTRREKDKDAQVWFAQLRDGAESRAVESDLLGRPGSLGFVGIPGSLAYDVPGALARYYDLELTLDGNDLRKDFTVTENVETAYAKLDLDTDLGERVRLRGNIGLQYVRTDQSSEAYQLAGSEVIGTFTRGTTYDDVLPSLNLIADFGEGWMIRFGAAKTLARPRIDDLRASAEGSVCEGTGGQTCATGTWSGNGGNPELEPWRATAYDMSFEKYFGTASYAAVSLFYKDLDSYIYTQVIDDYDFSNFVNTSEVQPISNIGTFTTPGNGGGGYLRGAELSLSLEGGLVTPALDGFGLLFNGSYTETSIDPDPNDDARLRQSLPGLSKIVANATLYYENNGFGARVSQRYRDEFQGEVTALFAQRTYTRVLAESVVDLQVGYEFQPGHRLAGWGAVFQVNNVTDEPYRTVQRSDFGDGGDFVEMPLEYNLYGRQYLVGLSYKF